jgi:glyoxylase-like metal-dependent hydrolase (beta-lactamase superfamily II)
MQVVPGLHWVESIWDAKVYLWIDGERVTVVDAAMPGRAGQVLAHVARLGYRPEAVAEIWLTHGDVDHMGSVAALKARCGARLVVHRADVPLVEGLAARELGPVPFHGALQRLVNWGIPNLLHYRPAKVDRALEDGDRLGAWQAVHVPGHTSGSLCYYHAERRIVLVGDAINHRRGRLGPPPRGFSPGMAPGPLGRQGSQAFASIAKIAALDFEVCCFGHGPPLVENARRRVQELAESNRAR